MRVEQPVGLRGSLKWMQRVVNDHPFVIGAAIRQAGVPAGTVEWLSPLAGDGYAEYRDVAFLERIRAPELAPALGQFWPRRGPQWDALGIVGGEVLLVEAKAHIAEMLSPPSGASGTSLEQIDAALMATANTLDAVPLAPWSKAFYQLGNRLAFLNFLNANGVPARLVLLGFVGDGDMGGPETAAECTAAYRVADHVMGLPRRHRLSSRIHHAFVDVRELEQPGG